MKERSSYSVTAAQLRGGVQLHAATTHRIRLRPHRLALLELEDLLFGLNSAVLLPYPIGDDGTIQKEGGNGIPKAQGLGLIYVTYQYLSQHSNRRLLIAGHTDTSGEPGYNLDLSGARAETVFALLMGKKETWKDVADAYHRVEDVQRLLKYYAVSLEVESLDPGPIDNDYGPQTRSAVEAFQQVYNAVRTQFGLTESSPIAVDGIVGPETWGAVFDLYLVDLAQMLGCAPVSDNLDTWREGIQWVDVQRPYVGFGESFPVDERHKDNYRSQENRRVELLFFAADDPVSLPRPDPPTGTHEKAACPFYDPSSYERAFIEPGEYFAHSLELQTVDERGAPVGNVALTLKPVLGGECTVQSDGNGYCRVEDELPPGRIRVLLDDGSPAGMRFQGAVHPAVVRGYRSLESAPVTSIIVEAMTDEERRERETVRRIYGNHPEGPSPSTSPEPPDTTSGETGPRSTTGDQPAHEPEAPRFYAHDNLMLAAADLSNDRLVPERLYEVVAPWLRDRFPQVQNDGFALMLLDENHLRCFGANGSVEYVFDRTPGTDIVGSFGAYALHAAPGGGRVFLDMDEQKHTLVPEGQEDTQGVIPIHTLLDDDGASALEQNVFAQLAGEIPILYYTPTSLETLGSLAMAGGAGYLEAYIGEEGSELRNHLHQRNLDTLAFVRRVYEGQIHKYIQEVERIGADEGLPSDASAEEKKAQVERQLTTLHAMGPPPSIYKFPMPAEATDQEKEELNGAGSLLLREADYDLLSGGYDPLSSEYRAWVAVSDKIDGIHGRHSEGAVFLKADFTLADAAEDLGIEDELTFSVPHVPVEYYFKISYEKTLEVGSDGFFVAGADEGLTVDHGWRFGEGPATIEADSEGKTTLKVDLGIFELEEELSASKDDGVDRIVLGGDNANVEIKHGEVTGINTGFLEISEDGSVTLMGANGTSATYNCKTEEFGYGWDPPLPGVDYIGLHMKGIYEETIQAYLARAPGFFDSRLPYEFYDPALQWNDLTSRERISLKTLGWNEADWDRRSEENFTYEDHFPPSARKSWFDLSSEERHAVIQLGMDRDDWKTEEWKASATREEADSE